MRNYFNKSAILDCDCFVADYTEATDSRKGVEISTSPFTDIPFFHLKKISHGNILYLAVNFEEYPTFIKGIRNCECAFSSISDCRRPWLLMLETKYCAPENTENHAFKAYSQMHETLSKLESEKLLNRQERNVYFVYSVPGHDECIPFGAFTISQNDTLKAFEQQNIQLLGYNTMLIATPEYLFAPKVKV